MIWHNGLLINNAQSFRRDVGRASMPVAFLGLNNLICFSTKIFEIQLNLNWRTVLSGMKDVAFQVKSVKGIAFFFRVFTILEKYSQNTCFRYAIRCCRGGCCFGFLCREQFLYDIPKLWWFEFIFFHKFNVVCWLVFLHFVVDTESLVELSVFSLCCFLSLRCIWSLLFIVLFVSSVIHGHGLPLSFFSTTGVGRSKTAFTEELKYSTSLFTLVQSQRYFQSMDLMSFRIVSGL